MPKDAMSQQTPRREVLKAAALLAPPVVMRARGANDKINIGWIGMGARGNAGVDWLKRSAGDKVALTAVCDTFSGHLARAKDRVQTIWGTTPATYADYRQVLADRSIDAVFIMTPDDHRRAARRQARLRGKTSGAHH
ncbi:MAG: hypothetical protein FJW37_07790 [Acidobacteria bacterium]|nr:hypothetical protein [Acidobacteriota bacterium]